MKKKRKQRRVQFIVYHQFEQFVRDEKARASGYNRVAEVRAMREAPPLNQKERRQVVSAIVNASDGWRSTPFEREGTLVHGIRSGLCLAGSSWPSSDREARRVVDECLSQLGARRPSWEEAQREHTFRQEQCVWCHVEIPDELDVGAHVHRYCSSLCARSALEHRDYRRQTESNASYQAAAAVIQRTKNERIECQQCERNFYPSKHGGKFCSTACMASSFSEGRRKLADRSCAKCETTFRPTEPTQKFCSVPCSIAARSDFQEERRCRCCGDPFIAKGRTSSYCSESCGNVVRSFRSSRYAPKSLTPRVFDFIAHRQGVRATDVLFAEAA